MVDRLYLDLDLNEQLVNESVKKLKEWLYMQPHLPRIDGKYRVRQKELPDLGG
jgi:hypothetical protein